MSKGKFAGNQTFNQRKRREFQVHNLSREWSARSKFELRLKGDSSHFHSLSAAGLSRSFGDEVDKPLDRKKEVTLPLYFTENTNESDVEMR